jgi:hypothetical protein
MKFYEVVEQVRVLLQHGGNRARCGFCDLLLDVEFDGQKRW